ncbi:MAG: hypothetical protein K1X82_01715 [Bacteroidia bacterium]|nr:hypothetical protein [Bacteroidia bacterium]
MNIKRLKKNIELKLGYTIRYPKDCETISKDLREGYNCNISSSTLKRLFGFSTPSAKPHLYTLDLLSNVLGYTSWDNFCQEGQEVGSCNPNEICFLNLNELREGQKLILEFLPEKKLLLEYLNNSTFLVLESIISAKIKAGFTLEIKNIVKCFPLVCHKIFCPEGTPLGSTVIGKVGGIKRINILREDFVPQGI